MISILWADDEIDILKPHIIFLEQKGYNVVTAKSGDEALDRFNEIIFDFFFLYEATVNTKINLHVYSIKIYTTIF